MKINTKHKAIAALSAATLFCINVAAQTNYYFNITATAVTNGWAITNELDGSLIAPDGHYLIPPQRIALSAKISGETVTKWTTTSIEYQQGDPTDLVFRPPLYHQTGVINSNTLATIQWHGKPVTVILETIQLSTTTRTTWQPDTQ